MLANINGCVSSRARGRVGSYHLSVFEFQIVAVFGRIRIVHLAHYLVRFEFESNIRYSPIQDNYQEKEIKIKPAYVHITQLVQPCGPVVKALGCHVQ